MGEGPRDNAARACRHDWSVAVTGERAGGRVGEERLFVQVSRKSSFNAGAFLGLVSQVPGSLSRLRQIQRLERRCAQSAVAAAHAAREVGSLPTRAAKEESHTRQVFAHAHAGEDVQVLVLLEVRVLNGHNG